MVIKRFILQDLIQLIRSCAEIVSRGVVYES